MFLKKSVKKHSQNPADLEETKINLRYQMRCGVKVLVSLYSIYTPNFIRFRALACVDQNKQQPVLLTDEWPHHQQNLTYLTCEYFSSVKRIQTGLDPEEYKKVSYRKTKCSLVFPLVRKEISGGSTCCCTLASLLPFYGSSLTSIKSLVISHSSITHLYSIAV